MQRGFIPIVFIIIIVASLLVLGGGLYLKFKTPTPTLKSNNTSAPLQKKPTAPKLNKIPNINVTLTPPSETTSSTAQSLYFTCEQDSDCGCGTDNTTGQCAYGNKEFINTFRQCPDFCGGFTGKLTTKCISGKCTQKNLP